MYRDRLKEVQGIKKKAKAGQQRAEDRAEQARTARPPLGMQNRQRASATAGMLGKAAYSSILLQ